MKSIKKLLMLLKHIPTNYNLVKRVYTSFNNMHFDAFDAEQIEQEDKQGILYSLAGSRVHEMRGRRLLVSLTEEESVLLITLAASISDENSLLDILLSDYCTYGETRKKGSKLYKNLTQFIKAILLNEETLKRFQSKCARKRLCNDDWLKDTVFLSNSNNERIGAVRVYTQALIHSNLFDASVDYRHVMQTLTLADMVEKKYKKPFVCYIDKENGKKYFGVVKYFFRLTYTSGVISVPICAIHWINFQIVKDSVNCSIGQIRLHWWNTLSIHEDSDINKKTFVSFNDLEPSRYALSYLPPPNMNPNCYIQMAFIALDSEKLGERPEDKIHVDFGDNKFPYYLGTAKTLNLEVQNEQQDEEDENNLDISNYISKQNIEAVKKYVPESILKYMCT